jgi:hypothetical protein
MRREFTTMVAETYLSESSIGVTGKFRLKKGLNLTTLPCPDVSRAILGPTLFGSATEGRTTMKAKTAKKPAAKKPAKKAAAKKKK